MIAFSCVLSNFRAYSKAIKGGGGGDRTTDDGGSSNVTSSDGGANTITSLGGGRQPVPVMVAVVEQRSVLTVAEAVQPLMLVDIIARCMVLQTFYQPHNPPEFTIMVWQAENLFMGLDISRNAEGAVTDISKDIGWFQASGDHTHWITIDSHQHSIWIPDHTHYVYLPTHTHDVYLPTHTHGINIPTHTHAVDIPTHHHDYSLPNHTHDIEYGIYKGPSATKMTVYLDDTLVGTYGPSISAVNLIDHMSKNANGDIMRGKHVIRVVPDTLTRVECIFQIRLFTNMHGGKQY